MSEHRRNGLIIWNSVPTIQKLYAGRHRLRVICELPDNNTDWYFENKDNLLAEFGTLSEAPFSDDPAIPDEGQTWPNQRLVRHEVTYFPPDPTPKLSFEYEELTDQYVESESEKIDYDLNGLRRVTRTLIAIEGTEYNKDVGVDSIEHTALGYGTETLYLASVSEQAKDDNESGFTLIKEVWLQPGVIRESTRTESGGLVSKSITTWYDEPSISGGAVESVVKDNVEGFNVWTASVKERLDGQPITDGVAQEYEGYFDFQYPGVASAFVKTVSFPGITARFCGVRQSPPITTPIPATVTVKYFTGTTPPALQEDLWAPSNWAQLDATWINVQDQPRSKVEAIRGYRVGPTSLLTLTSSSASLVAPFNEFVPAGNSATISLAGGPENPEGNTYVINEPRAEFAFSDEDGTEYFRWVEVIATIPAGGPSVPI